MEIHDLARVLWRKKWLILATPLVACIATMILLSFKKDEFKSEARLATGFTIDKIDLNDDPNKLREAKVRFQNLLELMKSPVSYNLLSYKLLLHDLDPEQKSFRQPRDASAYLVENDFARFRKLMGNKLGRMFGWKEEPENVYDLHSPEEVQQVRTILTDRLMNMQPLNPDDPDFELIHQFYLEYGYGFDEIRDRLTIERLQETDFVEVEFTSKDRNLSAYAANAFCQEFIRYYNSITGQYTTESVSFLEEVASKKKADLDARLQELREFKGSGTSTMGTSEEASTSRMGQLVELENQRDEIRSRIQAVELRIQKIRQDIREAQRRGSPNLRVVELQEQINDLNNQYITGGAKDKELSDSLASLRGELRHLLAGLSNQGATLSVEDLQSQLKDADIEYQVERNRLSMVESKINQLNYGFSNQVSKEAAITAIQNEIDMATEEYLAVAGKHNEARNMLASGSSLRLVLAATPALHPVSIKNIYILGLAVLSSLALAFFVVIVREVIDNSIKTPSRFLQMVNMPLIGAVNKLQGRDISVHGMFIRRSENKNEELYKSSLRQIRHQLESMRTKVVLFTSLKPRVGKSSIIFSLAYVLSLLKKRVLVIDTNFQNSSLTGIYGEGLKEIKVIKKRMVPSKPVLVEVLENGSPDKKVPLIVENSFDLVNPTRFEDIFFVGNTGLANNSPAELLSSKDFGRFIALMADQFDYVFLEGAALNDAPDSRELIRFVQKVVTVFSASDTIEPIDEHTIRYLQSLGNKSGGAILNLVKDENMNL